MDREMGVEYGEDTVDGSYHPANPADMKISNVAEATKMAGSNSALPRLNTRYSSQIPATVVQTAKDLSFDIVYHFSRVKKRKPSSKHATTLRRTVQEMSEKHEILFNGMVHKLEIGPDNAYGVFFNVAEEIFKDGHVNWGRIVSLYAFGAKMARHIVETHRDDKGLVKHVDKIANFLGKYVAEKQGAWIHKQGGWDGLDEHFPEQPSLEDVMWKGLIVTAFGLGALATVVAVR